MEISTTNLLGYTYIYFFLFFNKNVIEIKFSQGIYTGREKVESRRENGSIYNLGSSMQFKEEGRETHYFTAELYHP